MNLPLVSIIIPTFNRADLISETIESILVQTHINWECIVVDDGSTDDTEQLVNSFSKKDSRILYLKRPENKVKGANACRNYGFEIAKGDYINWFDSDDLMSKDFLEVGIKNLINTNNDFVLFDFKTFKDSVFNIVSTQKNLTDNLIEDYATWKINFGTWAILWKRSLVEEYKFDETLHRAQDLDFNLRVFFNESYSFKTTNHVGIYLRQHDENLTFQFNQKNIDSLLSEIKVRSYLINKLIHINTSKEVIKKSIKILNISLVKLYRSGNTQIFKREIKNLVNIKTNMFWYSKTLLLLFIYNNFKRGNLMLKNHLLNIPFTNLNDEK